MSCSGCEAPAVWVSACQLCHQSRRDKCKRSSLRWLCSTVTVTQHSTAHPMHGPHRNLGISSRQVNQSPASAPNPNPCCGPLQLVQAAGHGTSTQVVVAMQRYGRYTTTGWPGYLGLYCGSCRTRATLTVCICMLSPCHIPVYYIVLLLTVIMMVLTLVNVAAQSTLHRWHRRVYWHTHRHCTVRRLQYLDITADLGAGISASSAVRTLKYNPSARALPIISYIGDNIQL